MQGQWVGFSKNGHKHFRRACFRAQGTGFSTGLATGCRSSKETIKIMFSKTGGGRINIKIISNISQIKE